MPEDILQRERFEKMCVKAKEKSDGKVTQELLEIFLTA